MVPDDVELCVLFSSLFLPQLCDHFVFITRSSSWVSQGHEIPIWTAFQLWISYGNISPQGCRMSWGQGHTSRTDIPMKRCGKKKLRIYGLCRGCGISFLLLCFLAKNCKGCFFLCFMVMDFFAISISLCVWFTSQDWFLSIQSSVDRHRVTHKSSVGQYYPNRHWICDYLELHVEAMAFMERGRKKIRNDMKRLLHFPSLWGLDHIKHSTSLLLQRNLFARCPTHIMSVGQEFLSTLHLRLMITIKQHLHLCLCWLDMLAVLLGCSSNHLQSMLVSVLRCVWQLVQV